MIKFTVWTLIIFTVVYKTKCDEESCAKSFLTFLNAQLLQTQRLHSQYEWSYDSNITEETAKNYIIVQEKEARETRMARQQLEKFDYKTFKDPDIKRQIKLFLSNSELALPSGKYVAMEQLVKTMTSIHENAKVLKFESTDEYITSEQVFEEFYTNSDLDELIYYWQELANEIGSKIKLYYVDYVKLLNDSAHILGFNQITDMWLDEYENPNLVEEVNQCLEIITPLYKNLRAYVWNILRNVHGKNVIKGDHIPIHVLGHLQGITWEFIWDMTQPFPSQRLLRTSVVLGAKPMELKNLYHALNDFIVGINISAMPESFWQKSIFKKLPGRTMISTPKAYDFFNNNDYRIIHTSRRFTQTSYDSVFQLIGSIILRQKRSNLPMIYRKTVNPMFQNFGTVLRLSFTNAETLHNFKYIKTKPEDKDLLNLLHFQAMSDIPNLIVSYVFAVYRNRIFTGEVTEGNLNCNFWETMSQLAGIEPPVDRSNDQFDVATKNRIFSSLKFLKIFVSQVASYQIFRHLCELTGEWNRENSTKPLHMCDLHDKPEVGKTIDEFLSLGWSKSYKEILALTGYDAIDGTAIVDYFKPLLDFFVQKNLENNVPLDWNNPSTKCV